MRGIVIIVGALALSSWLIMPVEAQQSCAPTGPFRDWVLGSVGNAQRIVIAIDNSGSVQQAGRLPLEKQCAIATVQVLSGRQFAILSFNETVTIVQGLTSDTQTLINAINSIRDTSNATDIGAAINAACPFTQPVSPNGALVLETDGIPTRGSPDPLTAARNAANNFKNNCSILAVIGVDLDAEGTEFLKSIASPGAFFLVRMPTLTEWGLIALAVLLAGSLAFMIRRRLAPRPAGA
jgi:Mg-chelatase subunit ChlD